MGHGRACPVPAANGQGAEWVPSIRGTDRRSASTGMHAFGSPICTVTDPPFGNVLKGGDTVCAGHL